MSPGYLNRQSLLGEHRELHGLYSILVNRKVGYSRHPETLRWVGRLAALRRRHAHLIAEMAVRGYVDRTPLARSRPPVRWPETFVTTPRDQYLLLEAKYRDKQKGRIALPGSAQDLWAQHKYSVMARDPEQYRVIGRRVSRLRRTADFAPLADDLVAMLRVDPPPPRLCNALEHMWGYVRGAANDAERRAVRSSPAAMLAATRDLALRLPQPYLVASTALSDLAVFVDAKVDFTRR